MTREQAPQQGAAEPSSTPDARSMAPAPRPKATAPRPQGYGAAFGNGSGAAFVFRDLASI